MKPVVPLVGPPHAPRSRRRPAWWKGPLAVAALLPTACTLFVDTSDLRAGAAVAGTSSQQEASAPAGEGGMFEASAPTSDAGPDPAPAAGVSPCTSDAGGLLLCESFDAEDALTRYVNTTDPTTSIARDTTEFASAPAAATFTINPSTADMSPDATLLLRTSTPVKHFLLTADIRIDREEPLAARLIELSTSSSSKLQISRTRVGIAGTKYADFPMFAQHTWQRLRIEVNGNVSPATAEVIIGGVSTGVFELSGWTVGNLAVGLGVSEANSPTTGWLVHWDNIAVWSR